MNANCREMTIEELKVSYAKELKENEDLKVINGLCLKEIKSLKLDIESLNYRIEELKAYNQYSNEREVKDEKV